MTHPIPAAALPAYKRDPRKILCNRSCAYCGVSFRVTKKFPDARYCSRKCGTAGSLPPDHNARISRASAEKRGASLRGRGKGKTYPKMMGRHAHRVAAEQALGRALLPNEIVHHKDEDKLNYARENLDVLPSQAQHTRIHFAGSTQSAEHVSKRVESRKRTMAARK